jgi:hypothetical protein
VALLVCVCVCIRCVRVCVWCVKERKFEGELKRECFCSVCVFFFFRHVSKEMIIQGYKLLSDDTLWWPPKAPN